MIPYFISLLLVGIPICWAEWTLGRYGGARGYNSAPGIFCLLWPSNRYARYFGAIAVVIPTFIYMYYVYIEAWCLSYAILYATGFMHKLGTEATGGNDFAAYSDFFFKLVGIGENGFPTSWLLVVVVFVFFVNFFFIYRGVARGIELLCKIAMPTLVIVALFILARVLTLGSPYPDQPERNIVNALGFMWNPGGAAAEFRWGQLLNAEMWLAAAGQVFFSLSVGFGIILNYASYVRRDEDIVLSGLTSTAMNEFCEVVLAGLITIPLVSLFMDPTAFKLDSTMQLGFLALPSVFYRMPLGDLVGALWFLMLFFAAITSSLSMLQPAIAFLEEGFDLCRKAGLEMLSMIVSAGALLVIYFSKDLAALDTLDFWAGSFLIFCMSMVVIITFSWVVGTERGRREMLRGAEIPVPRIFWPVVKYVSPVYLLLIFVGYCWQNLGDRIKSIFQSSVDEAASETNEAVRLTLGFMVLVILGFCILTALAGGLWDARDRAKEGQR